MRRRYSNIQKKLAVERALKSRKRAKDVANELKISPSTLYRWLKEEDSSRSSKKIKYISRVLIGTAMDPFRWRRNRSTPFAP